MPPPAAPALTLPQVHGLRGVPGGADHKQTRRRGARPVPAGGGGGVLAAAARPGHGVSGARRQRALEAAVGARAVSQPCSCHLVPRQLHAPAACVPHNVSARRAAVYKDLRRRVSGELFELRHDKVNEGRALRNEGGRRRSAHAKTSRYARKRAGGRGEACLRWLVQAAMPQLHESMGRGPACLPACCKVGQECCLCMGGRRRPGARAGRRLAQGAPRNRADVWGQTRG